MEALKAAITPNTCAFWLSPSRAKRGIKIPPAGFLADAAKVCQDNNVLFMVDEIQTGLGRTGKMFCYMWDNVKPDVVIVGKALSGGFYPVSAVLARADVMAVFNPGDHGSTFGGNPLACAVARAALKVLVDENLCERSNTLKWRF